LRADGPDCLVQEELPGRRWPTWFFGGAMLAATGWGVWLAVEATLEGGGWGLVFLIPTTVPAFFVWLIVRDWLRDRGPQRVRFDRAAGVVAVERRERHGYEVEATRPLADVLAVQLIHAGYHTSSHTSEGGGTTGKQFHTYEMNVLFDSDPAARMRLCGHSDWDWMRREGGRLADFLGVPVVDQLHHG
jgi:hypothetical protein